jgi:hypothetical protein
MMAPVDQLMKGLCCRSLENPNIIGIRVDLMSRNWIASLLFPDILRLMGVVLWVTQPIECPCSTLMSMGMERS